MKDYAPILPSAKLLFTHKTLGETLPKETTNGTF